MLKRSLLLLSLIFIFLNATLFATGESGWIYVLNRNDNEISVIEPGEKRLVSRIPLSGQGPTGIYPAPSGKYLFITFKGSELISVVDTEEQKEIKTFTAENIKPETITFSPMGDWVYMTHSTSNEITVFRHKKLVLEAADNFPLGTAGTPIVLNRRGTRFYRSSPDGLAVVYAKTNRIIKNVTFPNGSMTWAFSPDFRYLWGIGLEKEVVVVIDEKKARLVKTLDLAGRPQAPIFSADGRKVFLIYKAGVRVIDTRAYKQTKEIPFPDSIDSLAYDDNGLLWAGSSAGRALFAVDPAAPESVVRIDLPGEPLKIVFVKLKKGEGYACF